MVPHRIECQPLLTIIPRDGLAPAAIAIEQRHVILRQSAVLDGGAHLPRRQPSNRGSATDADLLEAVAILVVGGYFVCRHSSRQTVLSSFARGSSFG